MLRNATTIEQIRFSGYGKTVRS